MAEANASANSGAPTIVLVHGGCSMSERAGSTVEEVAGSHAIYVSRPDVVADLIRNAASANV